MTFAAALPGHDVLAHELSESSMTMGRNLAAGIASSIWAALVGLAVIPFYIRYLGVEGYGLIGFLATALAVAQVLDLGLAATVNREVARGTESGDLSEARTLLHTVAALYWMVAGFIAMAMALLSPFIAMHWLRADGSTTSYLGDVVMLMGLMIACRWPGQLYQGALMGIRRIVSSSVLNIVTVTLGSGGAVFILAFVSPSVPAFLLWQSVVGVAYTLAARRASWRIIGRDNAGYDWRHLERIWRFSAGLTGIAISGIVLGQLDKLVLSKMLGLPEYGQYMLAVAVAGTLYLLSAPFFNAVYPRFSGLVNSGDTERLADIYRLSTRLLGTMIFPIAMLFCVFPEELIHAWTGDPELASRVAPLLPILAIGTALHGIMHIPYALQLAYGMTRLPLMITAILLILSVPLTVALVMAHGAIGGAVSWLALHALYLVLGCSMTHRSLLKGLGMKWLALDVGVPFAASALVGLLARYMTAGADLGTYARLGCGAVWTLIAFALALAASPELRVAALRKVRGLTYRAP